MELAIVAIAAAGALALLAWPWVRQAAHAIPDATAIGDPWWGADSRLILWVLAWDVHALRTQPFHLFDSNIFHPAPRMLTGSEHLLSSTLLSGPVYVATGNPVLAANVAVMASYVLAAVAMFALLRTVGLSRGAACVGAAVLPLGPLRVPVDLHVLQYPNYLLPLLILAACAAEVPRGTIRLVCMTVIAAFSSYHLAAMAAAVLGVEVLLAALAGRVRQAARIAGGAAVAFALLVLFSLPYARNLAESDADPGQLRTVSVALFAAIRGRLFDPGDLEFGMGWGVVGLAVVGLAAPLLTRRRPASRWWRWIGLVIVGGLLACGSEITLGGVTIPLPYAALIRSPLRLLRAFPRFVVVAHVGVAGLAAEGAEFLLAAIGDVRAMRAPVLCALVAAASWPRALALGHRPLAPLPTGRAIPAVYRWLRESARGPLLEIPAPTLSGEGQRMLAQSESMYFSTFHWLPLVNGHTGYPPWWWRHFTRDLERLPDASALRTVVDFTGVRWILVRRALVAPDEFARWEASASRTPGLVRVPEGGVDLLLHVLLPQRRPWWQALAVGPPAPGRTILGTPLASLAETARGRIDCHSLAPSVSPSASLPIALQLENFGPADWPGLGGPAAPAAHLVVVRATWVRSADGAAGNAATIPLPRDVIAGESLDFLAKIGAPGRVGSYTLTITLEQIADPPLVGVANARLAVEVR